MRRSPRSRSSVVSLALSACLVAGSAGAQDAQGPVDKKVIAAANAFAQAQEAELGGEHARAAQLFELADRIAPTPEALRSATRARLHAGELAAAAGHAEELVRRYGSDPASRELADQVLTRSRPELTRFRLQCETPCTVVVDGLASGLAPTHSQLLYATPGSHEFVVSFDGGLERSMRLSGERGEALAIRVQRPPKSATKGAEQEKAEANDAPPDAAEPEQAAPAGQPDASFWAQRRKLAPVYLWSAVAATAVVGGVATWSGVDLLKSRDEFEQDTTPTRKEFDEGESKDLRTGLLIGATGALALGSVGLALFTDFGGKEQPVRVSLKGRDAAVSVRVRF